MALFEIVAASGGPVHLPVPWADRPDQSWLVSAHEFQLLLDAGPLELLSWNQGQAALDAIAVAAGAVTAPPTDHQLGLHVLMPDYEARMASLGRNVAERRIELVQAIARRRD